MRTGIYLFLAVSIVLCGTALAREGGRVTPVVKIVREWSPAVVNISTEQVLLLRTNPLWEPIGGMANVLDNQNAQTIGTMKLKSVGSGVIVSKDGLILTNAHVVQMASKIYVMLNDGVQAEAAVEAMSQADDLALIKIKPPETLKPVKMAGDMMIGETVIAVGNPLGLENSVSCGIISGLNRNIMSGQTPVLTGLIQTDASINQGSSGGALFNLDGELVGINIAVVQGANSIGVAIPYDRIQNFLKSYREGRLTAPKAQASQDLRTTQGNVVRIPIQ